MRIEIFSDEENPLISKPVDCRIANLCEYCKAKRCEDRHAMYIAYSNNEKPDKRDWFISTLWKMLGLSYIQKKRMEFKNASRNGGIQ